MKKEMRAALREALTVGKAGHFRRNRWDEARALHALVAMDAKMRRARGAGMTWAGAGFAMAA